MLPISLFSWLEASRMFCVSPRITSSARPPGLADFQELVFGGFGLAFEPLPLLDQILKLLRLEALVLR